MTCNICCENYNKSSNLKIICPIGECNFDACKKCVRQYLLSTVKDPSCMKCNAHWNQQFIIENLNKCFWENEYKNHRTKILTDAEISKIPETIQYASNYNKIQELSNEKSCIATKISELTKQLTELKNKSRTIQINILNLKNGIDIGEKKKFIMPCQNNGCKGFLSSQYKCEICELFTCPHCFEIIGHNKNDNHTCDENNIKSAEEIKKTTKPCPNCGERIFKIIGCDQMWCTQCKVAFSWNTGRIENKTIHNPHYYDYIKNNGGIVNRNVGDIHCGGIMSYHSLYTDVLIKLRQHEDAVQLCLKLTNLHRLIGHLTYHDLQNIRQKINSLSDFKQLRAKYILKIIDKKEFSKQIYYNDKIRRKNQELLYIYEILSTYGIEFFKELEFNDFYINKSSLLTSFKIYLNNAFSKITNLFNYCNNEFKMVSATYNLSIIQININDFTIDKSRKFLISELKKSQNNN